MKLSQLKISKRQTPYILVLTQIEIVFYFAYLLLCVWFIKSSV